MGYITGTTSHANITRKVAPSRQMDPVGEFESEVDCNSSFRFSELTSTATRLVPSVDKDIVSGKGAVIFEFKFLKALRAAGGMASESDTGLSLESERSSLAERGGRVAYTRADGDGPTVDGVSRD